LGLKREEREADKTFHSVSRLIFLSLRFNLVVLTRASPFLREDRLCPFIFVLFSTAAKVPVNKVLFSMLLLLLVFFKINASSREREGRRSGKRGRNLLLQFWGRG